MAHCHKYYLSGHNQLSCCYLKHDISETGFCLQLQIKPTLSWALSTEVVPVSGHLYQHNIGYTKQAQHKQ
jgi:hypothetical protein